MPPRPRARRAAAATRAAGASRTPRRSATPCACGSRERAVAAGLARHRGHPDVVDAARHDPLERLKVVVHVHREPVRGHAARHPHADRRDLRVARPHARERRLAHLGRNALVGERGHDRALHRVHEVGHPLHGHDRVGHELPGTVVGHTPAAVRVAHLDAAVAVPVLAHRQVGGLGAPALRVHGRVLEHEQQVGELARLAPLAKRLLQLDTLPVGDRSELRHPEFSHGRKATLRCSGSRRALLARPRPLAAARGVDVAHLRRRHAARRSDHVAAAAGGRRRGPDPRRAHRDLRQSRADRGGGAVACAQDLEAAARRRAGRPAARAARGAHRPDRHRPAAGHRGRSGGGRPRGAARWSCPRPRRPSATRRRSATSSSPAATRS